MNSQSNIPLNDLQPNSVTSKLTPKQIERIKEYKRILGDLDPGSVEDAIADQCPSGKAAKV